MKAMLIIYLKGIFMGGADIVPGISGGTIALLVGIYERFINAIKSLKPNFMYYLFTYLFKRTDANKEKFKSEFFAIDWLFLMPLGFGIMTAFALGSKFIPYAMEAYPIQTYSFFLGLIFFSIKVPFKKIKHRENYMWVLMFLGAIIAFYISGLTENTGSGFSYHYIFLCGFIAISAMMLPGVSGSFLLLVLGAYKYILEILHGTIGCLGQISSIGIS